MQKNGQSLHKILRFCMLKSYSGAWMLDINLSKEGSHKQQVGNIQT